MTEADPSAAAGFAASRRALDRAVRRERGRLIAGLVARFGPQRLDLVEDVTQEALLEALSAWAFRGLPDNPGAWLARVARNKAVDRLRRSGRETGLAAADALAGEGTPEAALSADMPDPELRLMLLCADPALTEGERLALTLTLAGGFTAREAAQAFLAGEAALGQRVARAKRKLRAAGGPAPAGDLFALRARAPIVRRALHLMFGLGYAPRSGDRLVREDVCREALRLTEVWLAHPGGDAPESQALAALMCFQAARLRARMDEDGAPVLLRDQDRGLWDPELIAAGAAHLARARAAERPSSYHLEAAIAGAHAMSPAWAATDWAGIVRLYEALAALTGSPAARVNGAVAAAMAGDAAGAAAQLEALAADPRLRRYAFLHQARAEAFAALGRAAEADAARREATRLGLSGPMRRFVESRMGASGSLLGP